MLDNAKVHIISISCINCIVDGQIWTSVSLFFLHIKENI